MITVIMVSYNTAEYTRNSIFSLVETTTDLDIEIIVVDNASSDKSIEVLRLEFPGITLIENQRNIGFGAANNQAMKIASGDFIFILNPDTIVLDGAVETMISFLRSHPDAGIVGPKLYRDLNMAYHPAIRKFSHPIYTILEFMPLASKINAFRMRFFFNENEVQRVDWLWGAALLIRREVIEKIGMFDERYFMYSEEEDFCRTALKAGFFTYYCPGAQVVHFQGKSAHQNKALTNLHFWKSKLMYFEKHHSPFAVRLFRNAFLLLLRVKKLYSTKNEYETYMQIISAVSQVSTANRSK